MLQNQLHFHFSNRVTMQSTLRTQECIISQKHASFLPIQHKFIKWCLFITNWTNPSCFSTTEKDTLFLLTWIILPNIINHCLVVGGQELNEKENYVNKKQKENQDFGKLLSTLDPQSLNFSMISDFLTCIFFELVHISCS